MLLVFFHSFDVLVEGDILALERGREHQQVLEHFVCCAVGLVDAELELQTEYFKELFVLFPVVFEQLFQLILDCFFEVLFNHFELSVMLEKLTGNIERQVFAVDNALYEAEIIGQKVGALIHYHNAA